MTSRYLSECYRCVPLFTTCFLPKANRLPSSVVGKFCLEKERTFLTKLTSSTRVARFPLFLVHSIDTLEPNGEFVFQHHGREKNALVC